MVLRGSTQAAREVAVALRPAILHESVRHPVSRTGLRIGRAPESEVVLASETASREHAIVRSEDGVHEVEDLGTTNGTFVNGDRLRNERRRLRGGDTIAIGGEVLHFLSGEESRLPQLSVVGEQRLELSRDHLRIGRDPVNDIVLDHPTISRFHAEIRRVGSGVRLRDLGTTNGTMIDGRAVSQAMIATGAQIAIGPYRLVFDGATAVPRGDSSGLRLDADRVAFSVKGKTIVEPTSLSVTPGQLVAIIGESGAGKTTLMKMLAGVHRPTGGMATVSGEDVSARVTDIGYVPQSEIVHGSLTVLEALGYAARLRLPEDATREDVDGSVNRVLGELGLHDHAHTRIAALSGGQRRRVGVATELLDRPSLLFLDEPTTGLDPGLEVRTMRLLRDLASHGRAVVLVTHSTKSLDLCDKVVVMGRGGWLCFEGPPSEALRQFGVETYDDVYTAVEEGGSAHWHQAFAATRRESPVSHSAMPQVRVSPPARRRRVVPQAAVLLRRYAKVFVRDRRNLLIVFGQVPLLALLAATMFKQGVFDPRSPRANEAGQLLFLLVTIATWFGAIDAAREIVKERAILARETAIGVRLRAYLISKAALLWTVAAVQAVVLAEIVFLLRPLEESTGTTLAVVGMLVLTAMTAVAVGLFISAAVRSDEQATSFIPLALVPQLLFGGAIVPIASMGQPVKALTGAVFAQWSYAGVGTLVDMNGRIAADRGFARFSRYGTDFFDVPAGALVLILSVFVAVLLYAAALLLRHQRGVNQ